MPPQKQKNNEDCTVVAKPKTAVDIHARLVDKQQEQRLSTAVDAILAEWVRQEMGRVNQS
jgi:hypothetical protein